MEVTNQIERAVGSSEIGAWFKPLLNNRQVLYLLRFKGRRTVLFRRLPRCP